MNNIKRDSCCKSAEKVFLENCTDLPLLIWNDMSEEELKAYYQDLRNREKQFEYFYLAPRRYARELFIILC